MFSGQTAAAGQLAETEGKAGIVMDKKTEGKILDIAAELLVSPLAAYAKLHEVKKAVSGSETCKLVRDTARSAGEDIKSAAKKAYESETVQKGIDAARETARKVTGTEAYVKAKEGAEKVAAGIRDAAAKMGFGAEEEEEESEFAQFEEAPAGCCGADPEADGEFKEASGENIEDVIDEVDISDIITADDAKEDIPEE